MEYCELTDLERIMVDTFTKPLHVEIEGYRRALEFIRKMEWDAGCSGDGIYAAADAALSRQGCTCSLAAAGHDKHCAMRTSDERKETPTERAERAYQMQQEMRKANARVREVIAKSSSKSNEVSDGK